MKTNTNKKRKQGLLMKATSGGMDPVTRSYVKYGMWAIQILLAAILVLLFARSGHAAFDFYGGKGNVKYTGAAVLDNCVMRSDGTTGVILQCSTLILDDNGSVTVNGELIPYGGTPSAKNNLLIGPGAGGVLLGNWDANSANNIAVGSDAMNDGTKSNAVWNLFFGSNAGDLTTSGDYNTGVGNSALQMCTDCSNNVAVGQSSCGGQADSLSFSGIYNVCIGDTAGSKLDGSGGGNKGDENIFIGAYAGNALVDTDATIIIGDSGWGSATHTATQNIMIGVGLDWPEDDITNWITIGNIFYAEGYTPWADTAPHDGVAGINVIHPRAAWDVQPGSTGDDVIRMNLLSGHTGDAFVIYDHTDTKVGLEILANGRTVTWQNGYENGNLVLGGGMEIPWDSLSDNNVCFGFEACHDDFLDPTKNGADGNLVVGWEAGGGLTTGDSNVFFGKWAGWGASTASWNTAIGYMSCGGDSYIGLDGTFTGGYNVCIGSQAGEVLKSGSYNIFIGDGAGMGSIDGSSNTVIGNGTGQSIDGSVSGGDLNILIGDAIDVPSGTTSNWGSIGNTVFWKNLSTSSSNPTDSKVSIGTNVAALGTADSMLIVEAFDSADGIFKAVMKSGQTGLPIEVEDHNGVTKYSVTPDGIQHNLSCHGELYHGSAGTSFTIGSASVYYKYDAFTVGVETGDGFMDCDATTDDCSIETVNCEGTYLATLTASFDGTATSTVNCAVYVEGSKQNNIEFERTVGTAGQVGSASTSGGLTLTNNDTVDVRCQTDDGNDIDIHHMNMLITRQGI